MSMRFRKSFKAGGLNLNVNKKSIGVSSGVRGAHISANSKGGVTRSAGIPGTGISFRSSSKGSSKDDGCLVSGLKVFLFVALALLIVYYGWIPTLIVGIIYFIYCAVKHIPLNKKYIIVGSLIFAISFGIFIYGEVKSRNAPTTNSAATSQMAIAQESQRSSAP